MSGAGGSAAAGGGAPSIACISASFDMGPMAARLAALRPAWQVRVWPEPGSEDAQVAVCWDVPPGLFARMPRLALVHGIAAGTDNIVHGQELRGLPVCRVIDAEQVRGMVEYALWSVLYFHRGFDRALAQQARGEWRRPPLRAAAEHPVGVLGLGTIGSAVAEALHAHGYRVSAFNRSPRAIEGVHVEAGGPDRLPRFLAGLDTLVCLLPLTPATRGILNRDTFAQLPRGAALVHLGRGGHLVTQDLRDALRQGQLRGAVVDVFPSEPLAPGDPLWSEPGLVVTPHMGTMASPERVAAQIVGNVERLCAGMPLLNRVRPAP